MGTVECSCGRILKSVQFEIKPDKDYFKAFLNVIEEPKCPCGKFVVELIRVKKDKQTNKLTVNKFLLHKKIAYKVHDILVNYIKREIRLPYNANRTYLEYSEYGAKKKCYSNFHSLKLGLFDNTIGFEKPNNLKAG